MEATFTRREVLLASLGAAATAVVAAACGQNGGRGGPSRGQRATALRIGALGKSAGINRDPHGVIGNESDFLILSLVYEAMTMPGAASGVAPRLMARWEHSDDLTRWRFEIAEGAAFHDGSPVTSDDVVWSLQRLRATPSGTARLPGIEPSAITADGRGAVVLTSSYPNSELPLLVRLNTFTLPAGTTEVAGAAGSGPYRLSSYADGNARLVRNQSWHGGEAATEIVEVTRFESPSAMGNALLGGQIDLASNVGPVVARSARGRDVRVVRRPDDMSMPLVMRVADGPFSDARVREALRLGVDRQELVDQVLGGYGSVANDIMGTGDHRYAADIPQRAHDVERARSLLRQAAFDTGRAHSLFTTEDVPGLAEAATLIATQLSDIGVDLRVVKQDPETFYGQTWLEAPLYMTYWGTNDSVAFFASKTMVSDATQNEAAYRDPEFDELYRQAIGASDADARQRALRQLQQRQHDASGYLLWGMADGLDLATTRVHDLPTVGGYGRVLLERTWVEE